jgi:NADH:ubiquinone oxidoreductase subunit E
MGSYRAHVLVCGGAACASSGCKEVEQALNDEIAKQGLRDEIRVIVTGCMGPCELGPIIIEILGKNMVRLAGLEPAHPAPEAGALSPEL